MFKLSLHSINDDHLIIDITPDEHFKNNQPAIDHKPTQPRSPPISIRGGIGEQRGENKRISFTLN